MGKIVRITREEAGRRLGDVPEEKRFFCHDGRYLKNLDELGGALTDMSDETFGYHSRGEGSDFGNWVRDVVGDDKLARDLVRARSREQAGRAVIQRLRFLKSKL
ncbi:MAG: hypothetical protein ACNA7X_00585 [Dehalococcoidia bacterium]